MIRGSTLLSGIGVDRTRLRFASGMEAASLRSAGRPCPDARCTDSQRIGQHFGNPEGFFALNFPVPENCAPPVWFRTRTRKSSPGRRCQRVREIGLPETRCCSDPNRGKHPGVPGKNRRRQGCQGSRGSPDGTWIHSVVVTQPALLSGGPVAGTEILHCNPEACGWGPVPQST